MSARTYGGGVEIYNNSALTVDLTGWQLRYVSSKGSLLTAKTFTTFQNELKIHPKGFVLVASELFQPELISPNVIRYKASSFGGLSIDGASVDLLDLSGNVVDRVGYGSGAAILSENTSAPAPEKAGSIIRKMNDGLALDTDNNFNDFELLVVSSPRTINESPPVSNPEPPNSETPDPKDQLDNEDGKDQEVKEDNPKEDEHITTEEPKPKQLNIQISELMIDPVFPLVDSSDEWIELYNPNDFEVDLLGYRIETGSTGSYKYNIESSKISAKSYIVIKSLDTPISLSNTSGKVSLYDNSNNLSETVSYANVEPGISYAKDSLGSWQWSTTPTENTENIITIKVVSPPVVLAKNATKSTAKSKSTTTKAKATAKTAASTKTAKSKAVKATQVKSDQSTKPLIAVANPIPNTVVAILLFVAIIYSVYEYRYEIRNKINQFRTYSRNR